MLRRLFLFLPTDYLFIAKQTSAAVNKQSRTGFKVALSAMISTSSHAMITKHKYNGVIIQLFKYQPRHNVCVKLIPTALVCLAYLRFSFISCSLSAMAGWFGT